MGMASRLFFARFGVGVGWGECRDTVDVWELLYGPQGLSQSGAGPAARHRNRTASKAQPSGAGGHVGSGQEARQAL